METDRQSHEPASLVLWQSPSSAEICARVAITGDFAPRTTAPTAPISAGAKKLVHWFLCFKMSALRSPISNTRFTSEKFSLPEGVCPHAPAASLDYLSDLRANTVGLANDHSRDCSPQALKRTREVILKHGMIPAGAGGKPGNHPEVRVWRGPDPIRVGFWAAAKAPGNPPKSGPARIESASLDRGLYALECMRRNEVRFCVALLHAGSPYSSRPDPADVRLMNSLAKWGFDVVAVSRSRRIGGAALVAGHRERNAFCFYGLGNLVAGRVASVAEMEGLVIVAGLNSRGELARMEVRPLLLDGQGFGEIPSPVASNAILERFRGLSNEISDRSYERLFYRDVAGGLVQNCIRDVRQVYQASSLGLMTRKARLMRAAKAGRLVDKAAG